MPLDPACDALLAPLREVALPLDQLDPPAMRQLFKAMPGARNEGQGPAMASVENRTLPGPAGEIPVRIYRPREADALPGLVYFHGGGFVICDLDTHDGTCRELAAGADCVVVSVDYRLAPEARFPAAPEDCYAATAWVGRHAGQLGVDPERIAVGGDSAGGNLTAAVTLMARERGGPALRHQLLIYPVTNHAFDTPSYLENADGYLLSQDMMRWFWRHYLESEADGAHPHASPLRAESLTGLPPATLFTAEYDPLRDEGEAYAARLREAGVSVDAARFDGLIHGFFAMTEALPAARRAIEHASRNLRRAFER